MAIDATTSASSALERRTEDLSLVFHLLPETVKDMAGRFGVSKAVRIATALSGMTVVIPKHRKGRGFDALCDALESKELAAELIDTYSGERLYLPNCDVAERAVRDIEIHRVAEAGLADGRSMTSIVNTIAKNYRLSDRGVWMILKKPPPTLACSPNAVHENTPNSQENPKWLF